MANNKFNKKRAIEICKVVLDAYNNKKKLFAQPDIEERMLPENQLISLLPKKDKEKQARWIFFSCLGDKLTNSTLYYRKFRDLYLDHPDFFDIENLKNPESFRESLEELTKKVHVATPNDFIRFTTHSAKKLISDFNGNPLNIQGNNHKDSVKNLKQFLGYGEGIASLYLIFLARYGIKKTEGLVPKIDRHFMRISAMSGIVSPEYGVREDKLVNELSKFYMRICQEQNLDVLLLDPTMWIIGHELCFREDRMDCKELCPIDQYCSKDSLTIKREDARLYKRPSKRDQLVLDLN